MNTPHSSRMSGAERWALMALLLLAFALRTLNLTGVPPGLHNDEVVDARFTELVVNGRLAAFFPEDTGTEPMHFYLVAPFMRALGRSVFALRLPAVFMSMVAMCVIYALMRRLLGPLAAGMALAGFGINFWTIEFGRIVLHVIAEVPLATLGAYCFWRGWSAGGRKKGSPDSTSGVSWPGKLAASWNAATFQAAAWWALSGVWVGLAITAYTAARVLPLAFLAFGLYGLAMHRSEWRRWAASTALFLAAAFLVVLPMAMYLAQNPAADQLDFFDINRPLTELQQGKPELVVNTALKTVGMFAFVGDALPYYGLPARPLFEPVGALLLAGGLLLALWRWRRPEYAFLLIWFFVSLLPGMLSQPAPNYTRTIGAQVVVFALPGIAVAALRARWRGRLLYLALAVLFAGNLAWNTYDYFVTWPSNDLVKFWHQSSLYAIARQVQTEADSRPVIVCAPDHLLDERNAWWRPARMHMRYLLNRSDLALRYYNCADTLLFTASPARYAFPDVPDLAGLGELPAYAHFLAAANPPVRALPDQLGWMLGFDEAAQVRLQAGLEAQLTEAADGTGLRWAPEAGPIEARPGLPLNFQDRLELIGYRWTPVAVRSPVVRSPVVRSPAADSLFSAPADSSARPAHPGDQLELITYWRVTGELPLQLAQFTHLMNAGGDIVAQQDRLAVSTVGLQPGDIFAPIHRLELPGDLPAGDYDLFIGLYTPGDGARLPLLQAGQARGDRLRLATVRVSGE